ncbi:MAG: chorismate lyase [Zoogloeaceae bacterium]|nr:chorismate lyase [Zoogloeaceae bacterium]
MASLSRLGNRPIGSVLFSDPGIRRGQLVYKKLDARHPLRHILVRNETLWARRSVFVRDKTPLLVNEVFMPEILRLV